MISICLRHCNRLAESRWRDLDRSTGCAHRAANIAAKHIELKKGESKMDYPKVVSRDEWLVARKDLLAKEKNLPGSAMR
jgi:hypothetical protein